MSVDQVDINLCDTVRPWCVRIEQACPSIKLISTSATYEATLVQALEATCPSIKLISTSATGIGSKASSKLSGVRRSS